MKMNQKAKQLICVLLCGLLLLATTPVCLPTAQAETGGSADAAFAAAFNDLSWMYYGDGYFFTEATDPKAEFVNKFLLHTRVLEQYAPDGADEFTVSAELYENHAFTYFQETDTLRAALRQQSIYNDGVYSSYIGGWGGPAVNFVYNSYADLGENGYEVYSFILWTYENDMTADDPGDEYTPSADDVEGVDYIVFQYDWDPDTDVYGKIVGGVKSKVVYDGTAPVKYLSIEQMSSSDFLALIKEKCTAHCYTDADDTTCNVCYEVRSAESDETPDCSTISGYVPTVDIIRDPGYWEADYATAVDVVSAASGKGVTVSFSGAGNQTFRTYCTQTYNLDGLHLSLRNLTGNGFSVAFFGYTDDVDFSGNALRFINYASGSVVLPKHPFDSTIEMNTDIAPFTTDVDIKIKRLDNGDWEYNINGDAITLTDEFVTGLVGDASAVRVQFFENFWVHSAMGAHSFDVVALHDGLCADELAAEEHEKKEIADTIAGDSEAYKVSADDFNGNYDYDDRVQWADNADGGVHCSITAFETANLGVNYLQQLSLNGAHVVVSDLKAADNFTLILGQTPSDYAGNYPDRSLVRFSADGSVIVYPSPVGDVIIAGSDAVKAMLTGTTTLLSFAVSDDGTVSLTVVNEAGVSTGVFTAYGEQWTDRTKAYIAFVGAFVRESLEFDILAIHGGDELCGTEQYEKVIRPVIDLIAAIGEVTLESGSAIEAAEAAYAALTDAQKGLVENYDVLTAARAQYDALVAALNYNRYRYEYNISVKVRQEEIRGYFGCQFDLETFDENNGLYLDHWMPTEGAIWVDRAGYGHAVPLDGLQIVIKDFKSVKEAGQTIAIGLMNNVGDWVDADAMIVWLLRSNMRGVEGAGEYGYLHAESKKNGLAYNEALWQTDFAADIWAADELVIEFAYDAEAQTVGVFVNGQFMGDCTMEDLGIADVNAVYPHFGLWGVGNCKYAIYSITSKGQVDAIRAAIDAIDAIGEVTLESGSAIQAAEDAYAALTDAQKALVENYDVLTAARAEYDVLVNQENNLIKSDTGITNVIGAVTYEDGVVSVPGDITQLGTFAGVLLSPDKAYSYRFTLTIPEASTYSIRIPIRFTDYNSDGYADKGQCLSLFPDIAVLSYDYWGEYPFYKTESATSQVAFAMQPGAAYDFEIVTTATAVTVYVDGEKLIEAAGSKIAEDTSIGFGGWSTAYTASDIMLQEVPAQRIADEEAAAEVDVLITAIGTVTLESGDAIEAAEAALAALEDYQRLLVTKRRDLNNARAEYDALVAEKEAADKAAAADVDALITAIGTVTLDSGDAIAAAEEAYAALTADQKACVTKRATLERVRAEYSALVAAAEKEAADKAAAADVDALITAIGTVTLESKAAIEAAEEAYAALTDAQKAKVTQKAELDAARAEYDALVAAAEKEAADKAAAKVFDDMVANLGEITLESGDAIQAAYDSYAALTADQKKLVTKMAELDAAYCEYTILVEQEEADKAAAAEVDALITAIGAVTLESKVAIEAAEEAYAALTDAQKAKVTKTAELDAARAEYDALVAEKEAADKAAAKAFDNMVANLGEITLESGDDIRAAYDAYAALTADQKKLVTKMTELDAAYCEYTILVEQEEADKAAAADVDALITAIGAVTLESKAAIEAAEDAYAALTDAQKAKVTQKTELDAARAEYDALVAEKEAADKAAAKAVDDRIQYVSAMITLESGPAIKEVEDAYAALTDDQKKLVTMRAYLTAARVQYDALVKQDEADKAAAAEVDALITAIGAVTLESGDAIEAAEDAYAALTDAQKAKVTQKTELDAARTQYDALVAEKEAADKAAAKAVDDLIRYVCAEITLESGPAIQAAEDAYAALTDDQKNLVTMRTHLVAAYCEYIMLVEQDAADKAAAAEVDALITAIGTVTLESKAAIRAAEEAYAALTDAQKGRLTNYDVLTAARTRYNALLVEWSIINDNETHKVSSSNFNGNDEYYVLNGNIQWQNNADGGVHCSINANETAYVGVNYLRELSLDGAHIVVSNLYSDSFALFLGKDPLVGTNVDPNKNVIWFAPNGYVYDLRWGTVISDSDVVKAMIQGMTTLLSFAVSEDGTVSLTVANEAGQSTGTLVSYDEQWTDHTKAYIAFVSARTYGSLDFDILAIHGGDKACGEEQYEKVIRPVIDLIDAIGEVTLDSGDAVKAAEEAYASLTKAQKKFVANYEVLAAARRTYAGLVLFDGGDGSAERPLLISAKAQLDCVRLYPYAHFKLLNDIVFTEADFAEGGAFCNGGAGWTPIGTVEEPFTGVFDGNGHTIKNLYIGVVDHTGYLDNGPVCVGLFGYVLSGTVKNLGMVNSNITAEVSNTWCCIGSIVGYLADGTVSGCYNMGTVSAERHTGFVGGIVGEVSGRSTVSGCYNVGNVSSTGDRVGGIAGSVYGPDSTVSGCYNVGTVSGSRYAGGIAGITAGYATVTDCYNAGSVNGDYAGGIVGTTEGYTTVTNCYNVGSLNGNFVGGIVGELTYGTVTNCYYLNTVQQDAEYGQTACTYEQMRQQETFQGFDFDAVWFIDDGSYGFPQLRNIPHFMPVSVTITQLPDTLTYFEGDSLDLAGMILTVTYNNGANGIVTDYTVSGYDPTPGIKVITVTYGGKTATFEVEVIAKAMVGITVSTLPDYVYYLEGGSLDLTGMVVTGIHNNGTSEIVTDYTVSGYTSTPGIKVITVTFGGLTATFEVEVIAKSPVSITVTKQPDKLVYLEGDSFSKAGLEVTVNYDNGTSELVTDYTVSGYDPTPGVKTVTVTYGGLTTSFEVEVVAKSLTSVIVVKQPAKLTYLEGESFDGAGMVVAAIYDNNVMEMVTAYIVSGYDSTPGTKTITVSFGGFTDTFTVVVNAAKEEETVVGEQLREELSTTKPGETVTLEGDAKVEQLMIPAGVTLDLNGHTLEGDYLAFFGNVEGGTIKAPKDHVVFLANNTKLPVWNGEEYVLVEAPTFQHLYTVKNNTLTYTFLPTFDASIHALLAAGGEASNVTVTVQMSWSPSSGGTASQNFVFADKFVKTVIDSYKNGRYGQVFTITLSNAAALTDLQYSAVVSSGTGASFAPDTPAPKV